MAGNKAVFDAAMKRAQDHVFADAWDKALREYQRALDEFPDDLIARTNRAQALFRLQQWPAALAAYQQLLERRPNDPFVLHRIADCQANVQQPAAAEQTYLQVAAIYAGQNQSREALAALRSLLVVNPGNRQGRERLAEYYRTLGERRLAIGEYLTLSRQALESRPENLPLAVRDAETAFALDNDHPEARDWLARLRRRQAETTGAQFDDRTLRVTATAQQAAKQVAMRDLEQMFDLGVQYQEKGQFAAARVQFEAALAAGLDAPALHYNLALLYQQEQQWAKAVEQLQRAVDDPEYTMSSYYALGECYRALGRRSETTRAFERAVGLVDLQHVTKNEVVDLIALYRAAADANLDEGNQSRAATLYTNLTAFLQARRWHTGQTEPLLARAAALGEQGLSNRLQTIGGPRPSAPLVVPPPVAVPPAPAGAPAPPPSRSGMLRPITDFLREQYAAPAAAEHGTAPLAMPDPAGATPPEAETAGPPPVPESPPPAPEVAGPSGVSIWARQHAETFRELRVAGGMPLDPEASALVDAADTLIGLGLSMAAMDCCFEVIRLDPDYLPIHLRMAEILAAGGHRDETIAKLQSVIDVCLVRGDLDIAARVFAELIALQPENINIRVKRATLLLDLGQQEAAVAEYLNLAAMYHSSGQYEQALEELRRLQSLAPQNAAVRVRAGRYLLQADRPGDALTEFSRALQLDPANRPALVGIFVSMVLLGNLTAWDVLQTLLEQAADPPARQAILDDLRDFALTADRPELFYALALLHAAGTEEEPPADDGGASPELRAQAAALDQGLALLPAQDTGQLALLMRFRRAHLAVAAGEGARAVPLLTGVLDALSADDAAPAPARRAFLQLPNRLEVYQQLARAYALSGDNAQGIESLQAAKAYAPYDRGIYTELAELYFRQGQLNPALVTLDELISHYQAAGQIDKVIETLGFMARLAPNNITVRRKLADTYLKVGYIELGLAELEILADLQRKAGQVKDAMRTFQRGADIYWQMGQFAEAFTIYERIMRLAPGDVDMRQQLIHLYITSGRIPDAIREQKRIAEIYLQQQRARDAIAALHELIALAPNDPDSYYALAEVLATQAEFSQAARLYGRLRRLEPAKDQQLAQLQAEMQRRAEDKLGGRPAEPAGGR